MNAPFKTDRLPEWRLDDLYSGRKDPQITVDLAQAKQSNDDLIALQGAFVAARGDAVAPGRAAGSRDRPLRAGDQRPVERRRLCRLAASTARDDPAWAKFEADLRARSSQIAAESLFFTLELNQLEDAEIEAALEAHPLPPAGAVAAPRAPVAAARAVARPGALHRRSRPGRRQLGAAV
jgi:oligoendopeptidase F